MHCIQTSGNCIRNITADQFAGATAEEIEDPRPLAEIIRQWSTLHPEFVFLARKFKIAVGLGARTARRCISRYGGAMVKNDAGRIGFQVLVGGGMGRTPYIAHVMREFVEREDILAFLEAVLRVYNQDGRRDNIYKERIKILINSHRARKRCAAGCRANSRSSSAWARLQLPHAELDRIAAYFAPPQFEKKLPDAIPDRRRRFRELEKNQYPTGTARPAMRSRRSR